MNLMELDPPVRLLLVALILFTISLVTTLLVLTISNRLDRRQAQHFADALTREVDCTEFVRNCCFSLLGEDHRHSCPTWGDVPQKAA